MAKSKGTVVLVHAMKAYVGLEVQLHSFLTLALKASGQLHFPATSPVVN
jgi:hypothetical protein